MALAKQQYMAIVYKRGFTIKPTIDLVHSTPFYSDYHRFGTKTNMGPLHYLLWRFSAYLSP